ncbi:CDP-alcohol phosphatidyltransferase [Sphingobacterium spiritivorum]|uniref:CDP-alcohol phosphatidyltransferase n=2 Tax=Sphingobacterium spiritivorum TaxID=258 RepID=A0A380CTE3_SPHSI|nr:CDP-alcohol phosphatidyltransferase [Sphingobacterium spiritivorum]
MLLLLIMTKKQIPELLIWSRLLMGLILIVMSMLHISDYEAYAITLLTLGLLSDVFDGIIARRLQVSTERLRRLDSGVDQVFFISVAVSTYIHCPGFFHQNSTALIILIAAEALTYIISFLKFKKEVATHSIGAKIWTLSLFATLVELNIHCDSVVIFQVCLWLGLLTRLEIMVIILTLKNWTNDVPSLYHAIQLRKGKTIKRNKLFNG